MDIASPRRILILSPPSTSLTPLLNALLSSHPSAAPTTNPIPTAASPPVEEFHHITTPYYTASIPIWTDTVPHPSAWKTEWLSSPGAGEVVGAIGAWIIAFPKPIKPSDLNEIKLLLQSVADVIEHHTNGSSDYSYDAEAAALFAVALPQSTVSGLEVKEEEWEDLCRGAGGWEFVDGCVPFAPGGEGSWRRNEFGEPTGLPRLLEALATNDWDGGTPGDSLLASVGLDFDSDGEAVLPGVDDTDEADLRTPLNQPTSENSPSSDLPKRPLGPEPQADAGDMASEVEALQAMMLKMQAVKEMGSSLPASSRRTLAQEAIREIMRTMP